MANDVDRRHKPEWAQDLAVKLETVSCHVERLASKIEAVETRLGGIETTLTNTRINMATDMANLNAKARISYLFVGAIPAALVIMGLWIRSLFARGS